MISLVTNRFVLSFSQVDECVSAMYSPGWKYFSFSAIYCKTMISRCPSRMMNLVMTLVSQFQWSRKPTEYKFGRELWPLHELITRKYYYDSVFRLNDYYYNRIEKGATREEKQPELRLDELVVMRMIVY